MTAQAPYESPTKLCEVIDARVEELAERLCAAGPKAAHVSASECHEIKDAIEEARAILAALPERAPVSAGGDADTRQMNDALIDFARRWKVDGDYLRCTHCDRPQIASRWREDFIHAAGCLREDSEAFPWLALARLVEPMTLATPAPPVGADWATMTFDGKRVMCEPEIRKRVESALLFAALEDLAEREAAERPASMYGLVNAAPTPAEARGVGDGVRALVAKWREDAHELASRPSSRASECGEASGMERCADELEAALAANKPAGEVPDA